ncbi:MAG: CHASE2 domain-containing protein, partial [Methylococcaceae bacterium]
LIGFDVVFSEPDDTSGLKLLESMAQGDLADDSAFKQTYNRVKESLEYDQLFAKSLNNRAVVLGYGIRLDSMPSSGVLPEPVMPIQGYPGDSTALHKANSYTANLPLLQSAAATSGFFSTQSVDDDGVLRKIPVLVRHNEGIYESLTLAMFRLLIGNPPLKLKVESGYHSETGDTKLEALQLEGFKIPVDEDATVLIPYKGYYGSFPYYSATDILNGVVDPDVLQGKIVLIGTTAVGLLDLRPTPIQSTFPGVEINANLLAGMLDQSFRQRPVYTSTIEFIEILFTGIFLILILPRMTPALSSVTAALTVAVVIGVNIYAWQIANLSMQLAGPVLLICLLYANQMFFGFFLEAQSKKRLTNLFGQYVPEDLVNEMVDQESDFGLGGENREMTVLFSDVRGFTTISEGLSPDQLSQLMNAFLTPLTEIIHSRKGTIDKYMGDAIMAFWGAPLRDPDHGKHGLEAAMAMIESMDAIRRDFTARGWPEIKLGVGVNTGQMNVGNMGSRFRMAYTVLGDAVNLGSRLEGLTKFYGVEIIVSETTRAKADDYVFQQLDLVRVKGKNEPVSLYEPLGKRGDVSLMRLQELSEYENLLKIYHQQNFEEAGSGFKKLSQRYGERPIYRVYLDRIEAFKTHPPGSGWDGAYNHSSK